MKNLVALLLMFFGFSATAQTMEVKGIVFFDTNGNGKKDAKEPGLADVVVSDQVLATTTNSLGEFTLTSQTDFPYVFISQPDGYVGKHYHPKAANVAFPLTKSKDQNEFTFIHASDTHVDSLNLPRMARFRQMADSIAPAFVIVSGDLIRDALRVTEATASNYYNMYLAEIRKFSMPVYSGVGNHELFGIERDKSLVSSEHPLYGKKMFRYFLGPNYYSFNYGGIHFVSIDGVDYQNLYYFGGVDSLQLVWLENDMKHLPEKTPVLTFNHIPFVSPGFSFQDYENDTFYGPSLLLQDGKLEHRHIVYNYTEVRKRIGKHPYPLALAGHYHAAMEGTLSGDQTRFVQTSAITRPDSFGHEAGFTVRSGFTVYKVKNGKIMSSEFVPLNLR
jgi:hypothetical protein